MIRNVVITPSQGKTIQGLRGPTSRAMPSMGELCDFRPMLTSAVSSGIPMRMAKAR